jgi:hypothetical protein
MTAATTAAAPQGESTMNIRNLVAASTIALLPLAASAATFIIPAAGTGPGVNDSHWQTDLTLHNVSAHPITAVLVYHNATQTSFQSAVPILPHATVAIDDVVHSRFDVVSGTGAIEVLVDDADASKLAINSRTINVSDRGEFGQDIPAEPLAEAAKSGDLTVITGPSSVQQSRFNFGLYAATAATVRWELLRADGTLAATKDLSYAAGSQKQYNGGIATLFNVDAQDHDAVHATLLSGTALFYGSAIDNVSGDPAFVPGIRTSSDLRVDFAGVDLDENGTIDVADANHDGVLDARIDIFTSTFPNYFRVVASGQNGAPVTYELVDAPVDALLIDDNGTISFAPGADVAGTTGELLVRATTDGNVAILHIPVRYR